LIISDVLGDPLDVIASGPTVADTSTPQDALRVLQTFAAREAGIATRVFDCLEQAAGESPPGRLDHVVNHIIGNNAVAVDAAGMEAERRGYAHAMVAASESEGRAEDVARQLARMARQMRGEEGPDCLISGGEPVVQLVESGSRGMGGRNQQLVLAALESLLDPERASGSETPGTNPLEGIAILSGGTDGEDGPTDAAGAWIDAGVVRAMNQRGLVPADYLRRNDAYHFFQPLDALLLTGPTHTNVCDVRVVVVSRPGRAASQ
jgi:glycerate-2-kinase